MSSQNLGALLHSTEATGHVWLSLSYTYCIRGPKFYIFLKEFTFQFGNQIGITQLYCFDSTGVVLSLET